ncbi:MAG: hypothetical protein KGQ28_04590, partial [Hyphomicrobiales bacterium]|nr:hypothetical protein [Hyphomicrobiales bacterium]
SAFLDRSAEAARAETEAVDRAHRARMRRITGALAASVAALVVFGVLGVYALRQKGAAEVALVKAKESEKAQKTSADEAKASAARARASERNALAIADDARRQELGINQFVAAAANSAMPTLSPMGQGFAHFLLASAFDAQGDEAKFGREIEAWRKTGLAPDLALTQSAYAAVLRADAGAAIEDSKAAMKVAPNPVSEGNLAIAHVMRGEYADALVALDEAPKHYSPPVSGVGHDLAPDIKAITGKRSITPDGSDALVALDYFRAAILAMKGDPGFVAAMKSADAAAGPPATDDPGAATAQLFALQMVWLAARGQALAENMGEDGPKGRRLPTGWKSGGLVDYGVYAAQGAIWESASRALGGLQPEYVRAAARAYARFRTAYAKAPRSDYAALDAFARTRLADPALDVAADAATAPDPRAMALQAVEIKAETTGRSLFDVQPAIDRLGLAIEALRKKADAGAAGRRDRDLELELLIERSQWYVEASDWQAGLADADAAVKLAPNSADAHAARAAAMPAGSAEAIAEDRRALDLQPANWRALKDLAQRYSGPFPTRSIVYWERYRRVPLVIAAPDWRAMANVQFRLGRYSDAKASVAEALALSPVTTSYCADLQVIDVRLGAAPDAALAGYADCLAKAADALDRAGRPGAAVAVELESLQRLAAAKAPGGADVAFERDRATRAISSILTARFGGPRAMAFWDEIAKGDDPVLKPAALRETARLSPPPPSPSPP